MHERNLIVYSTISGSVIDIYNKDGYKAVKTYASCTFDIRSLPLRLNLPMVYKPLDWKIKKNTPTTITLNDIEGGYLNSYSGELYNSFRLLTSHDVSTFYIILNKAEAMCNVLSTLQSQVFEINRDFLDFIKVNRNRLEEVGLLVDRRLSKLNIQKASDKLRSLYFNDEVVKKEISINILLNDLLKRLQQARYEDFILTLACSYKDYKFYLPAFVDFRGRIYRAGVLHFP